MSRTRSFSLSAIASILSSAVAAASTYVVDASGGPGSDFTNLPAAIAFAQPGDVLLVLNGTYSGFTLDKPLAILGQGASVVLSGNAVVSNLPAGAPASLVSLKFSSSFGVRVLNCAGTVIGDGLISSGSLVCIDSSDVRFRLASPPSSSGVFTLAVNASRVEVVDSTFRGGGGGSLTCPSFPPPAGVSAAEAFNGGEVHMARCNLTGGKGTDVSCIDPGLCTESGTGGEGLDVASGARALVTGLASQALNGGPPGVNLCGGGDGGQGPGVWIRTGSAARVSGASVSSIINQGMLESPSPDDPSMRILETPVPGGNLTFRVNAPVGADVKLHLGRHAIVQDVPGLEEDVLTTTNRVFQLGTVPASGIVSFNYPLSASWPKGFTLFFQAVVTLPDTSVRRTHSIPVVLR